MTGNGQVNRFNNRFDYRFKPIILVRFEVSAIEFGSVPAPSGSVD